MTRKNERQQQAGRTKDRQASLHRTYRTYSYLAAARAQERPATASKLHGVPVHIVVRDREARANFWTGRQRVASLPEENA